MASDKAWMAYAKYPQDGACLVFAPNGSRALDMGKEWIRYQLGIDEPELSEDAEVKELPDLPEHLWALYKGHPHVIQSPPSCDTCETWGNDWSEQPGMCVECWEIEYG